jgi:enterochelin esterase-like enzyme
MERMQVMARTILYVPGAVFMDTRTVPHGAVAVVTYYYLLHGTNESDDSWSTLGRGNFILDNLIADGKAVPMIVVMPNGHIDQTPPNRDAPAPLRSEFATFPDEFVSDTMPYVESNYRTIPDRSSPCHRRTLHG